VRLIDQAERLNRESGRIDLPSVILMTDEHRLSDPLPAATRLPAGAAVMARHSNTAARRALVEKLLPVCRARGLRLIVADDFALARDADAFGLHLPERQAAADGALRLRRRWRGPLLSVAAHSPKSLRRAAVLGADAALLAPVFPTRSHPGAPAIGLMRFLAWCEAAALPVYALGGIDAGNAGRLTGASIVGIAGIGGLA
jgi:thiamine-phosphate pyrophosphorylase